MHNALSVYDAYLDARHALCGAHITRELVASAEADPDQPWPAQTLRDPARAQHRRPRRP